MPLAPDPRAPTDRGETGAVCPASDVPEYRLLELVHAVHKALAQREEAPGGAWTEETVASLRRGTVLGRAIPKEPGGLAFASEDGALAFGHLHVEPGPEAGRRGALLLAALLGAAAPAVRQMSVGCTGLSPEEEATLPQLLPSALSVSAFERLHLVRALRPGEPPPSPSWPPTVTPRRIAEVPLETVVALDVRAFQGSVDERLLGPDPERHRRILTEVVRGRLGRFLPEASWALADTASGQLVGASLSTELSPRRTLLVDFMIDPAFRGRGLGGNLLDSTLRSLHALGYEAVTLWVSAENTPARRLYARHGFAPFESSRIFLWERRSGSA